LNAGFPTAEIGIYDIQIGDGNFQTLFGIEKSQVY